MQKTWWDKMKELTEKEFKKLSRDILFWTNSEGAVKCWKKYLQKKIKLGEKRLKQMKLDIDGDKILLERIEIYEHFKKEKKK